MVVCCMWLDVCGLLFVLVWCAVCVLGGLRCCLVFVVVVCVLFAVLLPDVCCSLFAGCVVFAVCCLLFVVCSVVRLFVFVAYLLSVLLFVVCCSSGDIWSVVCCSILRAGCPVHGVGC